MACTASLLLLYQSDVFFYRRDGTMSASSPEIRTQNRWSGTGKSAHAAHAGETQRLCRSYSVIAPTRPRSVASSRSSSIRIDPKPTQMLFALNLELRHVGRSCDHEGHHDNLELRSVCV